MHVCSSQTEKQQPSGRPALPLALAIFDLLPFLDPGSQAIAFREVHSTVGNLGQQTARINVLPVVAPDASVESDIENMESKRMKDEAIVFAQAFLYLFDICSRASQHFSSSSSTLD